MEHGKVFVYGLSDPRDRLIHYVGHTGDIDQRIAGHLKDTAITPKTQWIADLQSVGLQPTLIVLDVVDYHHRHREEYRWIYVGRERSWPLTNTSAMKTEKYSGMANRYRNTVFVEMKPSFSWGLLVAYTKDVLWDNSKTVEYIGVRLGLITLPLLGLAVSVSAVGILNIGVMTDLGNAPAIGFTMKISEIVLYASLLMALVVAGPLYVRRSVELVSYIWNSLTRPGIAVESLGSDAGIMDDLLEL